MLGSVRIAHIYSSLLYQPQAINYSPVEIAAAGNKKAPVCEAHGGKCFDLTMLVRLVISQYDGGNLGGGVHGVVCAHAIAASVNADIEQSLDR